MGCRGNDEVIIDRLARLGKGRKRPQERVRTAPQEYRKESGWAQGILTCGKVFRRGRAKTAKKGPGRGDAGQGPGVDQQGRRGGPRATRRRCICPRRISRWPPGSGSGNRLFPIPSRPSRPGPRLRNGSVSPCPWAVRPCGSQACSGGY